jgi:phosphoribosylamine--glycine ligase
LPGGYPEEYEKESDFWTRKITDSIVFSCRYERLQNGTVVSNGGRVLAITSYGNDFKRLKKILSKYR